MPQLRSGAAKMSKRTVGEGTRQEPQAQLTTRKVEKEAGEIIFDTIFHLTQHIKICHLRMQTYAKILSELFYTLVFILSV